MSFLPKPKPFLDQSFWIDTSSRAALASSALVESILPSLLRAPSDRDVRFINAVNPLYAAGIPTFVPIPSQKPALQSSSQISLSQEGDRSLRSIIYARHLQRVLDALARPSSKSEGSKDTSPIPDPHETTAPSITKLYKGSNVISVVVTPGYHSGYVRALVQWLLSRPRKFNRIPILGNLIYSLTSVLITPLLLLFAKSTRASAQAILETLFLPHPIKTSLSLSPSQHHPDDAPAAVTLTVKPGHLYRDLNPILLPAGAEEHLVGREDIGRAVWEGFERGVKAWENEEEKKKKKGMALQQEKEKNLAESGK